MCSRSIHVTFDALSELERRNVKDPFSRGYLNVCLYYSVNSDRIRHANLCGERRAFRRSAVGAWLTPETRCSPHGLPYRIRSLFAKCTHKWGGTPALPNFSRLFDVESTGVHNLLSATARIAALFLDELARHEHRSCNQDFHAQSCSYNYLSDSRNCSASGTSVPSQFWGTSPLTGHQMPSG